MNKLIVIIFLLFPIFNYGQGLTVLYPVGLTNGIISPIDTLDALTENNTEFELKKIVVNVDTIYNDAIGEKIPHYVITSDERPIILFKNHDFKKDKIRGEYFDFKFIEPDSSINFSINQNQFKIRASGEIIDKGTYKIIKNYRLNLVWTDYKVRKEFEILQVNQARVSSKNFIEAPKIIWIGDLNDDQIPDLIIEESTHYALLKRGLYISSDIKETKYSRTVLIEGSFD